MRPPSTSEVERPAGPAHFDLLCNEILPRLLEERDREDEERDIRIWSAGCATGEELYSIAMALTDLGVSEGVHILGTDVNRRGLQRAIAGRYPPQSYHSLPHPVTDLYFERRGEELELDPRIRDMVEFRYLNLVTDDYPSPELGIVDFDVILCRNVLVGVTPESVRSVGRKLIGSLRPSGSLIPGPSDPRLDDVPDAYVEATHWGLVYRRVAARFLRSRKAWPSTGATAGRSREATSDVQREDSDTPARDESGGGTLGSGNGLTDLLRSLAVSLGVR